MHQLHALHLLHASHAPNFNQVQYMHYLLCIYYMRFIQVQHMHLLHALYPGLVHALQLLQVHYTAASRVACSRSKYYTVIVMLITVLLVVGQLCPVFGFPHFLTESILSNSIVSD